MSRYRSLSYMNPGPSLNPPEPDWDAKQECFSCPAEVRLIDMHRLECSQCDGGFPLAVVYVCFNCSLVDYVCPTCSEVEGEVS